MAASLPVVASNTGVHPEIVEQNESGFLVNNEQEWIDALSELIENKGLQARFGARGVEIVNSRYSYKKTSRQMINHLNKLIPD